MADRKGTHNSNSTTRATSSTSSPSDRVLVFELHNYQQRTATFESVEGIERKYSFEIRRGQRHVDVTLPGDERRKEASAHIAKVKVPIQAWVGRFFGSYKKLWAVLTA
ncbi:hypothetical protein QBC44DRAFT_338118 [Cladorrhinum sp. PSN332]|nr:hypothetical protein QBC44DRAFT_338118 [Cladorrhinum sp. PSN332]